jgi:hypothetical protein
LSLTSPLKISYNTLTIPSLADGLFLMLPKVMGDKKLQEKPTETDTCMTLLVILPDDSNAHNSDVVRNSDVVYNSDVAEKDTYNRYRLKYKMAKLEREMAEIRLKQLEIMFKLSENYGKELELALLREQKQAN